MYKMYDYKEGKIYKIVCNKTKLIYIGSTIQKLNKRLSTHTRDFKNYNLGKRGYCSSFKIIENNDFNIELIELYPCENKLELHKKEREWIEKMDCVNINKPCHNAIDYRKEYYQRDNVKERNKLWQREYRKNQPEKAYKWDRKKELCPHCENEYGRKYLKTHILIKHK